MHIRRILGVVTLIVATTIVAPHKPAGATSEHRKVYRGFASVYSPGVMERVARIRNMRPVACMISSPLYPLGTWVWVRSHVTGITLRCRTTDVSHPKHIPSQLRRRQYVELANGLAWPICRHKYAGQGPIRSCPVSIWQ